MNKKKSLTPPNEDKGSSLAQQHEEHSHHCYCSNCHEHHHDHHKHHMMHSASHKHDSCNCNHQDHYHNHGHKHEHELAPNESYLENMTEEEMTAYVNQLNSDMYDTMELSAEDKEQTAIVFDEFMRHLLASAEENDEEAIALLQEMQEQFHTILAQDFASADEQEYEQQELEDEEFADNFSSDNTTNHVKEDDFAVQERSLDVKSHLKAYVAMSKQASQDKQEVVQNYNSSNQSSASYNNYSYDDEDYEDDDYDFDDEDFGFLSLEATPGMISVVKLDGSKETEVLAPYSKEQESNQEGSSNSKQDSHKNRATFTQEEKSKLANSYADTISKARELVKQIKKTPKK